MQTPLCSKRNGILVIKIFLVQKFANSSVVNLVSDTWFNEKNAIKNVCRIGILVLSVLCLMAMVQALVYLVHLTYI